MNKRCVFLEHAVSLTGLSNVKVVRGRAEVSFLLSFKKLELRSAFALLSIWIC